VIVAAKTLFTCLGIDVTMQGTGYVPRHGGAVLASNHVGYLDFIFAGLGADPSGRHVRFMAKDSIWKHPVGGPLMRGMKHIPVDRDAGADSFLVAREALRRGEIVGIFPEATISRSFELKEFKSGVARLAQDSGVPILPTVVWGTQRFMTKGRPRDFSRGKAVLITIGEPIDVPAGADLDEVTRRLQEDMRALLAETMDRYPQAPHGPDDTWWIPASRGGTAPTPSEATRLDRLELLERARRKTP